MDVIPCDADPCVLKRGGYYQSHASRSCHQCIDLRVRAQTVANFQFQCIGRLQIALSSKRRHSSEARIHLKSQRTLPPPPPAHTCWMPGLKDQKGDMAACGVFDLTIV